MSDPLQRSKMLRRYISTEQPKIVNAVTFNSSKEWGNRLCDELIISIIVDEADEWKNYEILHYAMQDFPASHKAIALEAEYMTGEVAIFGNNLSSERSCSRIIFRAEAGSFTSANITNYITCFGEFMTKEALTEAYEILDPLLKKVSSSPSTPLLPPR